MWLALLLTTLATRPLVPIDETRYVTVAWEMWQRGDFLVPHLNGLPYSHKPPLLFWLMHGGWWLFGVNEWWPRLVPALAALANVALVRQLAKRLWPEEEAAAELSPWILSGFLAWAFYSTAVLFDMLVVCGVLGVLYGLVLARDERPFLGFSLAALGTCFGLFAKGPVVLAFALPPILLGPWWARGVRPWRWGLGGLGALAAAVLGILAWALPAARAGGEAYSRAILWGQTADRVVAATAHPEPFWWYAAVLPLMLLPFSLWPALWRRLRPLTLADSGVRLCLAATVPSLLVMSLISAKQPHYLLAALPPLALVAARAAPPGTRRLALAAPAFFCILHLVAMPYLAAQVELHPIAGQLAQLERRGVPIAHRGIYHGQFHFLGRLEQPFEILLTDGEARAWLASHPDGALIAYYREAPPPWLGALDFAQPFRGQRVGIFHP